MPSSLRELPRDDILLRPFEMVGLEALRSLLHLVPLAAIAASAAVAFADDLPALDGLIDLLAADGKGLITREYRALRLDHQQEPAGRRHMRQSASTATAGGAKADRSRAGERWQRGCSSCHGRIPRRSACRRFRNWPMSAPEGYRVGSWPTSPRFACAADPPMIRINATWLHLVSPKRKRSRLVWQEGTSRC